MEGHPPQEETRQMTNGSGKAIDPWEWDIRVRERNVRKGIFDEKDIEKHIAQLTDVSDQAELVTYHQPALSGRES